MVDVDAHQGAEESRIGPGQAVMIALDAIQMAHLRVLASREGMTPDALAERMVSQRLHDMADDIWTRVA